MVSRSRCTGGALDRLVDAWLSDHVTRRTPSIQAHVRSPFRHSLHGWRAGPPHGRMAVKPCHSAHPQQSKRTRGFRSMPLSISLVHFPSGRRTRYTPKNRRGSASRTAFRQSAAGAVCRYLSRRVPPTKACRLVAGPFHKPRWRRSYAGVPRARERAGLCHQQTTAPATRGL